MKKPKQIIVAGKRYSFRLMSQKSLNPNNEAWGRTKLHKGEIEICDKLSEDVAAETILHEIVHIVNCNTDLDLNETQVTCLSSNLFEAIKANKEFFSSLVE